MKILKIIKFQIQKISVLSKIFFIGILIFLVLLNVFFVGSVLAKRTTPEDIVSSKKLSFEEKVKNYSPQNIQKLQKLSGKITQINKTRTDELSYIMNIQGQLLDEYQNRLEQKYDNLNEKDQQEIEKARYWITFAHEAVAYQAAKIYIFNLTYETNIKSDAKNLTNLFQSELNYARSKVLYSQSVLKGVLAP